MYDKECILLSDTNTDSEKESDEFVEIQLGKDSLKVFDFENCGVLLEEWIAKKRRPKILSDAEKYPVSTSLEERFGFQFDLEQQINFHKFRNRKGGKNKKHTIECNTKWRVELRYFLRKYTDILIQARIHYFAKLYQCPAIWRTRQAK